MGKIEAKMIEYRQKTTVIWKPIHEIHYKMYLYEMTNRFDFKIDGKIYTQRSKKLKKAIEKEVTWAALGQHD